MGSSRVAAGGGHTCGTTAIGQLVCWGYNHQGQINIPAGFESHTIAVSTGFEDSCGIDK